MKKESHSIRWNGHGKSKSSKRSPHLPFSLTGFIWEVFFRARISVKRKTLENQITIQNTLHNSIEFILVCSKYPNLPFRIPQRLPAVFQTMHEKKHAIFFKNFVQTSALRPGPAPLPHAGICLDSVIFFPALKLKNL